MLKAAQAYLQTQVNTTTQGDLLIMLYDGAIKFLKQAKDKIEEKDYAQKGILISKAIDIIAELAGSLNVQKGGDLAENLHKLYFYCNTRLLQANMRMETEKIDEVITILNSLRDAFAQVLAQGINAPERPNSQSTGLIRPPGAQSAAQFAAGAQAAPKQPQTQQSQEKTQDPATPQRPEPAAAETREAAPDGADHKPAEPARQAGQNQVSNAAPAFARRANGASLYKKIASQT